MKVHYIEAIHHVPCTTTLTGSTVYVCQHHHRQDKTDTAMMSLGDKNLHHDVIGSPSYAICHCDLAHDYAYVFIFLDA